MTAPALRLAVALDGPGRHPAAWRFDPTPTGEHYRLRHWAALAAEAERGAIDLVTFEDRLTLPPRPPGAAAPRGEHSTGRFDAVQLAAAIAPLTRSIGLVPTATVTHTEPFHLSTAVATLDFVSEGRAGWLATVSTDPADARNFGRRPAAEFAPEHRTELEQESSAVIEAVRRLWDSWEDGAVIRDVATGRYLDRDRLHRVNVESRWFSILGPSVTPRSPQGQPPIALVAADPEAYQRAAREADLVFVAPRDAVDAAAVVAAVRAAQSQRSGPALRVFADLVVFLDQDAGEAQARLARWNDLDAPPASPPDGREPLATLVGTPKDLAVELAEWAAAGLDGLRLHPGGTAADLPAITRGLVPQLRAAGLIEPTAPARTLRERLGLARPVSRYAA